jgi:hypothetical protein
VVATEKPMQMIVASRLTDGRVVFMAPGNSWAESIDEGIVTDGDSAAADLLAEAERAAKNCVVVEPYLIEITMKDGRRRPVLLREAIRAFGPTVHDSEAAVRS